METISGKKTDKQHSADMGDDLCKISRNKSDALTKGTELKSMKRIGRRVFLEKDLVRGPTYKGKREARDKIRQGVQSNF